MTYHFLKSILPSEGGWFVERAGFVERCDIDLILLYLQISLPIYPPPSTWSGGENIIGGLVLWFCGEM